jgi:hypothetical protein
LQDLCQTLAQAGHSGINERDRNYGELLLRQYLEPLRQRKTPVVPEICWKGYAVFFSTEEHLTAEPVKQIQK